MKLVIVGAAIAGLSGGAADAAVPGWYAPPQTMVQQTGNGAQSDMKTVTLAIEGMTCGNCADSIKTALKKIEGVRNVDVSFEQKGGTAEFDPAKVNEQTMVEAVNNAGYKAQRGPAEKS